MEKRNLKKIQNSEDEEQEGIPEKIGDFGSVSELTKNGLSLIIEATKAVNTFPSGASRDLYSAHPTFGKVVGTQSDRILGIISEVMKNQNVKGNIQRRQEDEQFELILECNDAMLERINSNLDELAGIRKNPQTILIETKLPTTLGSGKGAGSWNVKKPVNSNIKTQQTARLITAKNIARPQTNFKVPIDNSSNNPFEPRIKDKPNSLKPLAVLPEYDEEGNIESYLHPYEFELDKFKPPERQLVRSEVALPKKVENAPLVYVNDEDKLKTVINELKDVEEIAVDLEHHSYRTFQGITCLMQISTKKKDYIIDALKLREELHALNVVFTNPNILKIFHGADLDILWLQRDLSLYVVNMFDTHQAAKLLSFPRLSLAYLLKHYCGIEADKTFQLADWRIRPLPEELISYARQDTHFLIYIYELLRNDLLKEANNQPNLLKMAYQKSMELCKRRYIKPKINADSHMDLYRKSKRIFDNRQLFALKEIFLWRDKLSRQEDESYGYILPNHMMLQISESLPREMQGILACCNPIPPLVRQNLHLLHQIILKAREQPLVKPIINDAIENRAVVTTSRDFNSKLYCPHDMSYYPEFRDDLPTLLGPIKSIEDLNDQLIEIAAPTLSLFEQANKTNAEHTEQKLQKLTEVKFITPYERYKAVIPYAEKQRLEELTKENELNRSKMLCPVKDEPVNIEIIEKKDNDHQDIYSLPLKESFKRKRKENGKHQLEIATESKKARKNDTVEGGDKLEFIEKAKQDKDSNKKGDKSTVFKINVKDDVSDVGKTSIVNSQDEQSTSRNDSSGNIGVKKKNKKKKFQNKSSQNSSQPVQFDYSKVSFNKFKGGSKRAKGTEIKPKFHGKGSGNKANDKKFNKLFTFGNKTNKKK